MNTPGARNDAPGVYHIEGTGATAKPERMSGEAVRSLRRNGAEPPNE
ncbi:MAG: hypothetical protein WCK92_10925 [Bacteroidota bacterium]